MFKEKGAAPAGGLFTWSHFGLLAFFLLAASLFYIFTKKWSKERILIFFKVFSLVLVGLEIFKIIWNIITYGVGVSALNSFIPLYYCSIFLFAFVGLAWGRGRFQHMSYSWLIYGGIISGVSFLIYPSSSLLDYPFYHFLSIHSMLFHSSLVLVALLVLRHNFYVPQREDFGDFALFSLPFLLLAFIINKLVGTNLMFLETPLALAPLAWLNDKSAVLFQIIMFAGNFFLPYAVTELVFTVIRKISEKRALKAKN